MNRLKTLFWHYSFRAWLFVGRAFARRYEHLTPCGVYKESTPSYEPPLPLDGGRIVRVVHMRVSNRMIDSTFTEFVGRLQREFSHVPAQFRNLVTVSFSADAYVEDWDDGDAKVGNIYLDMEYVDCTPRGDS